MAAPIRLREDLSSAEVCAFARNSKNAGQVRRLLAIARILDGGSRSEAALIAGVTLQIVRDWVLRYNEAGLGGLATRKAQSLRGGFVIYSYFECEKRKYERIIVYRDIRIDEDAILDGYPDAVSAWTSKQS